MKRATIALASLLVIAQVGRASVVFAEPTPADRALAESLFRDARVLADGGSWAAACGKFAESQRLDPKLGTLLYLATCHEAEGKLASAWIEFTEARALASRMGQGDREKVARERAASLETRLAKLVIETTSDVAGLEVKVDGRVLPRAALGSAFPIDPGEHVVSATAPDRQPFEARVVANSAAQELRVSIGPLEPAVKSEPQPAPKPLPPPPPPAAEGSSKTLGFVIGGAGVLALAGGTFFGLRALSVDSDADAYCRGNFCSKDGIDKHDEAKMLSHFSTAGFALGVIGVSVGTYLILSAKPDGRNVAQRLSPVVRF